LPTPSSEGEGMSPPPPLINQVTNSIIVEMSTGVDQAAGATTRVVIMMPKASDAMSTFTMIVISFMLEMPLALDEVAIFFFFLSLTLDQVTNSIVIDH
jgi:hypothetical protein